MRTFWIGVLVALVLCGTALGASGGAHVVISAPHEMPSAPVPGKAFHVSFAVHATGHLLTYFNATLAGRQIPHADSLRNGTASTSLLIPANANGKTLTVKLTAESQGSTATRSVHFVIHKKTVPSIAIEDAEVTEGNAGTTVLTFPVTLSVASSSAVSVTFATSDGTATAPSDYVSQSGSLVFAPGEVAKSIAVAVNGDTAIEPDETMEVTLSQPAGGKLVRSIATGTILNDDQPSPATPGNYFGTTQENNDVHFTVSPSRIISDFSVDSMTEYCNDNVYAQGAVNFGTETFPIDATGAYVGQDSWTGTDTEGDVTYTSASFKVTGQFTGPSAVAGTITLSQTFSWQDHSYSCTGTINYTAAIQTG